MRLLKFFLAFSLVLLTPVLSQAQEAPGEPDSYVKFRLLAERTDVRGGDEILIGTEESIHPGWHTYWKNPGDSGSVVVIDWKTPEGFEFGPVLWPAPHKLPYGPLLNYGYEDKVILLQTLKLPEELPDGPITLSAEVEVLVCKDVCIPEFGTYSLTLNDPDNMGEDNSAYLRAAIERLPQQLMWQARFSEDGGDFVVEIKPDSEMALEGLDAATLTFYPEDWGMVENVAEADVSIEDGAIIWRQKRGDRDIMVLEATGFVMVQKLPDGSRQSFRLAAQNSAFVKGDNGKNSAMSMPEEVAGVTLMGALLFALLGGVILNLMPCVFPVLSIKALSLIKISEKSPALARMHGVSYTAGILVTFGVIAGLLLLFKAAGAQIGWGFQLQNPVVVGALAYLLFLIGMNLMGFFDVGNSFGNIGQKLTQGEGLSNSFFMGVLATLVATPCTAPFMAAAIGYALVQPAVIAMMIFLLLGFGLALPYLLLSFIPALQSVMPRPGVWMEDFRQFLAFPIFASSAWLVWVLTQQAGPIGVLMILMGIIALGFAIWLLRKEVASKSHKVLLGVLAAAAFVSALALIPTQSQMKEEIDVMPAGEFGEPYSQEKLEEALIGDNPVFVEMTAAWCITCKVNHAAAINTDATREIFADNNVKYLIGDWTNQDPEITQYLNEFNRSGVPLYVYYGAPDDVGERPAPYVLPQILTPEIVRTAIEG